MGNKTNILPSCFPFPTGRTHSSEQEAFPERLRQRVPSAKESREAKSTDEQPGQPGGDPEPPRGSGGEAAGEAPPPGPGPAPRAPQGARPAAGEPLRLRPPPPPPAPRPCACGSAPGRRATYPPRRGLRSGPRHCLRTRGGGDGEPTAAEARRRRPATRRGAAAAPRRPRQL